MEEQIVIGTPGTMLDWCFKKNAVDVKRIKLFVLDEADIMIDTQGLSCQSIRVQRLGASSQWCRIGTNEGFSAITDRSSVPSRVLPQSCQMLLFSATFKERVWAFATQIISESIIIKLREEELTLANVRQYFLVCRSRDEKYQALCNIYGSLSVGQAMIFCQVNRLESTPGKAERAQFRARRPPNEGGGAQGGLFSTSSCSSVAFLTSFGVSESTGRPGQGERVVSGSGSPSDASERGLAGLRHEP